MFRDNLHDLPTFCILVKKRRRHGRPARVREGLDRGPVFAEHRELRRVEEELQALGRLPRHDEVSSFSSRAALFFP